jgi:glycosyltransferase involved in cell wall biosynthesis
MHILMIAPEPFFEPRGTPFSEYHRIRALLDLGHTVDLITYPFGRDVSMPGLRIFRCLRPPFITRVKIGPSYAKVPLDIALTVTALRQSMRSRYDAVHSHEEGSAIGVMVAAMLGLPHLYDMHSSLPQQLSNFAFGQSRIQHAVLHRLFTRLERLVIRRSRVVVVICPHLQDIVRDIDPAARTVLIENAPGAGESPARGSGASVREELELGPSTPVVLYTGTFEPYQGLDLFFSAARYVRIELPDARFVLVGGRPDQIATARQQARKDTIDDRTIFVGERRADEIPAFLEAADVLVSPRSAGTNTPLKIYQYLRAGRPIVATRLLTHTQVLNDEVAILTKPTPEAFAAGIVRALRDERLARRLGEQAQALAETRYSYDAYLDRTREACAALCGEQAPPEAERLVGAGVTRR